LQEFRPVWRLPRRHDGRDSTLTKTEALPSFKVAEARGPSGYGELATRVKRRSYLALSPDSARVNESDVTGFSLRESRRAILH
jgi:hypothetical protein